MGSEHKADLHLKKEALEVVHFASAFYSREDSTPALLWGDCGGTVTCEAPPYPSSGVRTKPGQ